VHNFGTCVWRTAARWQNPRKKTCFDVQKFGFSHGIQTHSHIALCPVTLLYRPSTCLPATTLLSRALDHVHCQLRQSLSDQHQMLLCDICNAGWHTDCLLPPLTTIPTGTWKYPLCTPRHPLPQAVARHLRLPSPILDFDSDSKNVHTPRYH